MKEEQIKEDHEFKPNTDHPTNTNVKIIDISDLRKHNNQLWKSTALVSLITLIVGLLLVFNPFAAADYAVKVVGILIFVSAVLDIVTTVRIKKTARTGKRYFICAFW